MCIKEKNEEIQIHKSFILKNKSGEDNMKKIGILTFHRAINYGACLQAYALKRVLTNLGADADVIDYRSDFLEKYYRKAVHKGESLKSTVKNILTWDIQKERNRQFEGFFNRYLYNGEKEVIGTKEELKGINEKYDIFITGSDQVWNPGCNTGDMSFLLDFVDDNNKKYSYSASFGYFTEENLRDKAYKSLISDYKCISVREKKGEEIAAELTDNAQPLKIRRDIDPTFLLNTSQWHEIMPKINKGKYVFVYSLTMPKKLISYAEDFARKNNLELICFTLNNLFTKTTKNKVITGTPEEFLSYLNNAEYVITNSFHGTAFSIIFNKKFCVIKNSHPQHDNGRLINILESLGISDCVVKDDATELSFPRIDYSSVNDKLDNLRKDSVNYLKELVGD